jgi:DNA-3-methyladenine glycosylase I
MKRCAWSKHKSMIEYHDTYWGVPVHDDRELFEMLILEGAQAGLSWATILKRRKTYKLAFDNFDVKKVAQYADKDKRRLLQDPGIIRNKLKVDAAIINAQKVIDIQKEFGSFDTYIWGFVNHKPIKNKFKSMKELPATTTISEKMSKDLKKRGFKFVGSTICYAFMQAVGMVNDHEVTCFRYDII